MRQKQAIPTLLVLAIAILACALPANLTSQTPAFPQATAAAQTLAALSAATIPAASPSATGVPTSLASPTTAPTPVPSILPHSLYFLTKDNNGHLQIFRLQQDGKTTHQITFEPADVDSFDISAKDGSLAYSSNNALYLVDANGAGRKLLVDGGTVNDSDRFTNTVDSPVWSPDGQIIAFNHGGLNFYSVGQGTITQGPLNKIDTSTGFPVVRELYAPRTYSPDGSKLLISIGFYEAGTFGIYLPSSNTLLRFTRSDGGNLCCTLTWVPDGTGLYAASAMNGFLDSGLWYINAADGNALGLLPGSAPDGTYNFADAPQVGPDGKLYFFFNNLSQIPASGHAPLFLVRSGPDGLTGRSQLKPDTFEAINEVLWAPDASLAVVVSASSPDVFLGGGAEIVYPDARPSVMLTSFAQNLRWGP